MGRNDIYNIFKLASQGNLSPDFDSWDLTVWEEKDATFQRWKSACTDRWTVAHMAAM